MNTAILLTGAIVGYFAFLAGLAIAARPLRHRLARQVDELLSAQSWNKEEREVLEFAVQSSLSSAVGVLIPFAAAYGLAVATVRAGDPVDDGCERLNRDPRYHRIIRLWSLSVAAASPFACLVSLPILAATVIVRALRGEASISDTIEAPARRVQATLQPGC